MASKVWISRGPNAGRILELTDNDAQAGIADNWAMDKEPNWTLTDEEVAAMQGDVNWKSYDAIQEKLADPLYSAAGEEDGSWPPTTPEQPPPEPAPPAIDNTLPDIPDPEKPPPGTEPPLGGSTR